MANEQEVKLEWRVFTLKNNDVRYCVVGPDGGIDFHVDRFSGDAIAGLECHYKRQPTYLRDKAPFTESCWLTGQRCWGDGTSLYATERLLPLFDSLTTEQFFRVLEDEYRKRFSEREISFIAESAHVG